MSLVRDLEQSHDAMYVEDQKPQVQEQTHDISLDGAAVKWGPMKLGEATLFIAVSSASYACQYNTQNSVISHTLYSRRRLRIFVIFV